MPLAKTSLAKALSPKASPDTPAFEVRGAGEPVTPLIFASPHSGRIYPADLLAASALDQHAIRRSEDAFVDELIAPAFERGVSGVLCRTARVYLDVNRDPWELDPSMFEGRLPAYARSQSARVAAGLGSIARVVGEGQEVYARKLSFAEAKARIDQVHRPYHQALSQLIRAARRRFGLAVLVDWHSMPSAASKAEAQRGRLRPDLVLGDRHGASCGRALSALARRTLEDMGYVVGMNAPYAGGFTTQIYGQPADGVHVLQIEIDRGIYLDEEKLERSQDFTRLARDVGKFTDALLAADWPRILEA